MAAREYLEALDFLRTLGDLSVGSDEDFTKVWTDRKLPLVCTSDWDANWSYLQDETGIFVDKNGARFCVEPQSHFAAQCNIIYQQGTTQRSTRITYAAIIVAKITWQAFLATLTVEERRFPLEAQRQAFFDRFIRKLPYAWREMILIGDLHLKDDASPQWARTSTKTSHVYSTLADPTNIRVVSIHSALQAHEPIRCSLHEERLDSFPEFQALSYAWGSHLARRDIFLNDVRFSVTENLYFALECLRQRSSNRTMWIDSICINQSDMAERQIQVAQMDLIYKQATEVIVWLGPETQTSSMVFKELVISAQKIEVMGELLPSMPSWEDVEYPMSKKIFFTKTITTPIGDECPECRSLSLVTSITHSAPKNRQTREEMVKKDNRVIRSINLEGMGSLLRSELLNMVESLLKLLQRPYWGRTWVLQEVVLARKLTVQCGRQSASWRVLFNLVFATLRLAKKTCWGTPFSPGRAYILMSDLEKQLSDIYPFVFLLQSNTQLAKEPLPHPLVTFLSITAGSQATDPHDKIYGLLGLLPQEGEARVQFQPNYSQPTKRLFISVAKYFLDTMKSLEMLTARPLRQNRTTGTGVPGLPSWVPDWTIAPDMVCNLISLGAFSTFYSRNLLRRKKSQPSKDEVARGTSLFTAGLDIDTQYAHSFSRFDEVFSVYGLEVDSIVSVFPLLYGPAAIQTWQQFLNLRPGDISKDPESMTQLVKSVLKGSCATRWDACHGVWGDVYKHTGQTLRDAFWRTVFLDRFYDTWGNPPKLTRIPMLEGPTEASKLFNHGGLPPYEYGLVGCNFPPQTQQDEDKLLRYLCGQSYDGHFAYNTDFHGNLLPFFITKNGYIGVGHPGVAVGDTVAVLLGGPVPYILRKYNDGHMLVGECYVHGIMDGELVKQQREGNEYKEGKEAFKKFNII